MFLPYVSVHLRINSLTFGGTNTKSFSHNVNVKLKETNCIPFDSLSKTVITLSVSNETETAIISSDKISYYKYI